MEKARYTQSQIRQAMGNYSEAGDGVTTFKDGTHSTDANSIYFMKTDDAMDFYHSIKKEDPQIEVYVEPAKSGLAAAVTSPSFNKGL